MGATKKSGEKAWVHSIVWYAFVNVHAYIYICTFIAYIHTYAFPQTCRLFWVRWWAHGKVHQRGAGEVFQWNPNSKQYWLNSDFHLSLPLSLDHWFMGNLFYWLATFSKLNFLRFTTQCPGYFKVAQQVVIPLYLTKWPSSKQASPGGQGLQVWHQRPLNFHHGRPGDPRNRSQRGPWSGYKFPPFWKSQLFQVLTKKNIRARKQNEKTHHWRFSIPS